MRTRFYPKRLNILRHERMHSLSDDMVMKIYESENFESYISYFAKRDCDMYDYPQHEAFQRELYRRAFETRVEVIQTKLLKKN